MGWIALVFVLLATVYDLKTREIPDAIPLCLLGCAIVASAFRLHGVGWASMMIGLAISLTLSMLPFALGGLGGGDVKLIGALGAALGHVAILPALFWIALAGGAFSLVALLRGRRDLAYVPSIALGLLMFLLWQGRAGYASLS